MSLFKLRLISDKFTDFRNISLLNYEAKFTQSSARFQIELNSFSHLTRSRLYKPFNFSCAVGFDHSKRRCCGIVAEFSRVVEKAEDVTPSESSCLHLAGGLPQYA